MRRRTFVLGLSGATGLGLVTPIRGLEAIRQGLTDSLAEDRAAAHVEEWQQIVFEHGLSYMNMAPADMEEVLAADLFALQYALYGEHDDAAVAEMRKAGAILACLSALTLGNVGRPRDAGRCWRTARRLADSSADAYTMVWVRGMEVVRASYEGRPAAAIGRLVHDAEVFARRAPAVALPHLVSGKAQLFALQGRAESAEAELERLRVVFTGLPSAMSGAAESVFTWPEACLRYTESFVYSHLGMYDEADTAQRRAIGLYPASYARGPVLIELQRALCLVRARDVDTGVAHAQDTLAGLVDDQHILPVVDLGRTVLGAVPAIARRRPAVTEYREYLARTVPARSVDH